MEMSTGIRKIVVRSPSIARETGIVAIVVFQIVFWSAVVVGASRATTDGPASTLQADEIAFETLDSDEQRMYRRALEGLAEAEEARAKIGTWPSVDELARRGIPPFAPDPIDRSGYRWKLVHDRYAFNYVGIPRDDRPTYVIAAIEPEPGAAEMAAVDETHHKIGEVVIHVGVWRGTVRELTTPLVQFQFLDGWRRVTAGRQ